MLFVAILSGLRSTRGSANHQAHFPRRRVPILAQKRQQILAQVQAEGYALAPGTPGILMRLFRTKSAKSKNTQR